MKKIQIPFMSKTLILTHGDSDGICSGAIAKSAFPNAYVFFTSPVNLLENLSEIKNIENLIICDIAINEKHCSEIYSRLRQLSEECNIYYIDHHPLPENCSCESWYYHDLSSCSSELTYSLFEERLAQEMSRVAIYGAIGDFCDNTSQVKTWIKDWDKRSLYFQAGTLIQAILHKGRDYDFKRSLLAPLSKDTIPSKIPELLEFAREAALNEEKIRLFVKGHVETLKNCAYIVNPNNSISKAAIYAASYGQKEVGIAAEHRGKKGVYDLSIRSRGKVDINKILRSLTPQFGGSGGGHPLAAGARIPDDSLKSFLHAFDARLGNAE